MKQFICLSASLLAGFTCACAQEQATVFQIGKPDGDYAEFAIAGDFDAYNRQFPHDVDFVVGQSDAKRDWPFIHPGPTDGWAGGRSHAFKITFALPAVAAGYYCLVLDFVSTHGAVPPRLTMDINGTQLSRTLPPGSGDDALTNPKAGKNYSLAAAHPIIAAACGNELDHTNQLGRQLGIV